jgi:KDO2-lipid IV(A) lauroyltransferase
MATHRSRRQLHGLNNGAFFRLVHGLVTTLPRPVALGLADAGTAVAHRVMTSTTDALVHNLRAVRPPDDERSLRRLARRTYRQYARDVFHFIRALEMSPAEVDRLFVLEGRDTFERVLSEGRGMLLVTGHFGNWEIGAVLLRHLGCPLDVVVMPEVDETVNALRRRFRDSLGVGTIEVRQSMGTALQIRERLAANAAVAMLMDRYADRDQVKVRFFGRDAYFLRAPALLAYLTGAPLVPCFVVQQPDGRYLTTVESPIEVDRALDRATGVQQAAQGFADVLERAIRGRPECWYQFYPFWDDQARVGEVGGPGSH